jgi:hypothetical protein
MKTDHSAPSQHRAEMVRQRRPERTQSKMNRYEYNVHNPIYATPSVTLRRDRTGLSMAGRPGAQHKPRKINFIPLSEGGELVMPSLPMPRFGWRLLSGFLMVVLVATLAALFSLPDFRVEHVTINKTQRIKQSDIESALNLEGVSIFDVNPAVISTELQKKFPDLTNIAVGVALPAQVSVTVTERVPVIEWKIDGKSYWVDSQGFLFTPRGKASGLVLVKADDFPPLDVIYTPEEKQVVEDVTTIVGSKKVETPKPMRMLSSDMDAILRLRKQLQGKPALTYNALGGFGWADENGWQVILGNLDEIDVKLAEYKTIVDYVEKEGIKPALISVEHVHSPYYRLER